MQKDTLQSLVLRYLKKLVDIALYVGLDSRCVDMITQFQDKRWRSTRRVPISALSQQYEWANQTV